MTFGLSAGSAALIAAGIGAAGSIASGVIGANASESAANTQAGAATHAADLQAQLQQQLLARSQPFVDLGTGAIPGLNDALAALRGQVGLGPGGNPSTASLTAKFNPTMEDLASTPGYKFAMDQGLKATQNGYAAQGLGSSGAALKGAGTFAQGLASTTYQNQFQNYLTQNQQIWNILNSAFGNTLSLPNLGANAAVGSGGQLVAGQNAISNLLTGAGNAQAAGTVGVANAAGGAFSGVSQNALLGLLLGRGNSGGANATQTFLGPNGFEAGAGFNPLYGNSPTGI